MHASATIVPGDTFNARVKYTNIGDGKLNNSVNVDLYLSDAGLAQVAAAGFVDLPAERIEATRTAWAG